MHHPVTNPELSLSDLNDPDVQRLEAIRQAELTSMPQRIHSSILKTAQGISLRMTKAIILKRRRLSPGQINRCIREERADIEDDARRFPTCNDLVAFEHQERVLAMIAKVLPHYFPCPAKREHDRAATLTTVQEMLKEDVHKDRAVA